MDCSECNELITWTQKSELHDRYVWKCQTKSCEKYKHDVSKGIGFIIRFLRIKLLMLFIIKKYFSFGFPKNVFDFFSLLNFEMIFDILKMKKLVKINK